MNLELIIGLIAPFFSAWAAFIFTRRKYFAESKTNELDNVDKAITIWRKLAEELEANLKGEMDGLRMANADLRVQFERLTEENAELRKKMKILDSENRKLIEQLTIFNKKNG